MLGLCVTGGAGGKSVPFQHSWTLEGDVIRRMAEDPLSPLLPTEALILGLGFRDAHKNSIWRFPKIKGTLLTAPLIRTIVSRCLY